MMVRLLFFVTLISLFTISCAKQTTNFNSGEWIDLSYDFSDKTIYWTEADGFKKETVAEGKTDKGYFYSAYKFSAPEHGGTHLDSPIHFAEGRKTVDQLPVSQLIAPAVKIDVSAKTAQNSDYLISVEDITGWEAQNGQIGENNIVLFQTGYGKFWGDRKNYMGTDGTADQKHFPGLSPEAAKWLISNRKVNAVGIDTASIDYGQSQTFDTHVALMGENVPAFENVANVEKLPNKGFQIIALPMKIKGGSGAPLRIVAFVAK
ncbi:MAG TPA: cyclase family protein [Pyrinomonadaceae bacterium]|nr:cyclase family protein [Pyrinomonadaceae bacterium]